MHLQPRKCQQALPAAPSFPCHRGYQQLLPVGGFDPAYFEGATAILAQVRPILQKACNCLGQSRGRL